MNAVVAVPETTEPRTLQPVSNADSQFNLMFRQAKALSSSDLAQRIGASPFAVMQNLHLIQGRPSWSATFLIATVNHSKRFEPLRFEVDGEDASAKTYRVRAYAKDRESGVICYGAWITWKMVEAEGWSKKAGSKWLTMPEQMFLYRAAAFWARVYAPEVSIGLHTVEEVQDVHGYGNVIDQGSVTNSPDAVAGVKNALLGVETTQPEPDPEYDPDTGELIPPNV
jgi:hypothetical protein